MNRVTLWALAIAVAMTASACGGSSDSNASSDQPDTTSTTATATVEAPLSPALPKTIAGPFVGRTDMNDLTIEVSNVTFHEDHISAVIKATNTEKYDRKLNDFSMALRDDKANDYFVSPPTSDPEMTVPANGERSYQATFLGRVAAGTRTLSLITNAKLGYKSSGSSPIAMVTVPAMGVER